jgi:hypothetical protein
VGLRWFRHFSCSWTHDEDIGANVMSSQVTPRNDLQSGSEVGTGIVAHFCWLRTHSADDTALSNVAQSLPLNSRHESGTRVMPGAADVFVGVLPLGEWSVMSIVGKDVKVGEAFGRAVEGLMENVNTLDVIGLYVNSGPEVAVALADEGVEGDDVRDVELSSYSSSPSTSGSLDSSYSSIAPYSPIPPGLSIQSGKVSPAAAIS